MTDRVNDRQPGGTSPASRRWVNLALWVLQLVLAYQFAFAGILNLSSSPAIVELFTKIGMGEWFRYAIGVLEIAGAIGLLIPLLTGLAALGLTTLMVGAVITNLLIGESPVTPLLLLVGSALVAWGRWPTVRTLVSKLRR